MHEIGHFNDYVFHNSHSDVRSLLYWLLGVRVFAVVATHAFSLTLGPKYKVASFHWCVCVCIYIIDSILS